MMQMEALSGLASSVWEGEPVVPPGTDTLELSERRSAPTYATEETAEDLPFLPCIDTNRLAENSLIPILWPYFKEFTTKATA